MLTQQMCINPPLKIVPPKMVSFLLFEKHLLKTTAPREITEPVKIYICIGHMFQDLCFQR